MQISAKVLSVVLALAPLAACGGAPKDPGVPAPAASSAAAEKPAATTPPPATTTAAATAPAASSAPPAAAATAWRSGMTKEEQMAFMKTHVMPPMTKVFQDKDGTKYAKFSCVTCHGPKYQEPKEFLPHLTLKDGKITAFAEKPAISKWMAEEVTPKMAKAMGLPPYDPATHQGFGCAGCHTVDKK